MNFIAGVTASRLMIRSLSSYRALSKPVISESGGRRNDDTDFTKKGAIFFIISFVVLCAGVVAALITAYEMDIQFKGGTILQYTYTGTIDAERAEDAIAEAVGKNTMCQLQTIWQRTSRCWSSALPETRR
jgi:hypothetical protein